MLNVRKVAQTYYWKGLKPTFLTLKSMKSLLFMAFVCIILFSISVSGLNLCDYPNPPATCQEDTTPDYTQTTSEAGTEENYHTEDIKLHEEITENQKGIKALNETIETLTKEIEEYKVELKKLKEEIENLKKIQEYKDNTPQEEQTKEVIPEESPIVEKVEKDTTRAITIKEFFKRITNLFSLKKG